jgi:hypothetical protein
MICSTGPVIHAALSPRFAPSAPPIVSLSNIERVHAIAAIK